MRVREGGGAGSAQEAVHKQVGARFAVTVKDLEKAEAEAAVEAEAIWSRIRAERG
jgi:hypothetical protein